MHIRVVLLLTFINTNSNVIFIIICNILENININNSILAVNINYPNAFIDKILLIVI